MGDLDEVSRLIGLLQGKVEGIETTVRANNTVIFKKLDDIHTEQTNNKITTAKISIKMGIITAVLTLGLIEGVKFYAKSHWGH